MLAIAAVQIACSIVRGVLRRARRDGATAAICAARIFHHVGELSAREVGKFGAPSLITRTTNDVQQVQMLVLMSMHDAAWRRRSCASAAS